VALTVAVPAHILVVVAHVPYVGVVAIVLTGTPPVAEVAGIGGAQKSFRELAPQALALNVVLPILVILG